MLKNADGNLKTLMVMENTTIDINSVSIAAVTFHNLIQVIEKVH
jgi:hypothetical protein